jgi:hypothetical protein
VVVQVQRDEAGAAAGAFPPLAGLPGSGAARRASGADLGQAGARDERTSRKTRMTTSSG